MPGISRAELGGFPAQILLLFFLDSVSAVAEELGVPLREAELPRNLPAAPLALALVPAAVHRPVPGEWRTVFAQEDGLDTLVRPVAEPIGELLNRDEVRVEVARVHRADVAAGMVVNDAVGIELLHDGFGA